MTREERELSITYLEGIKEKYIEGEGYERHPLPEYYAIDMAIKALEQEPCEDAISRQAAIGAVGYYSLHSGDKLLFADKPLKALPSVEPERKKGKWINHIDDLFPEESTMECSECHHHQNIIIDDNYCPYCGADMREVQNK